MKIYAVYCTQIPAALSMLKDLQENQQFVAFTEVHHFLCAFNYRELLLLVLR